MRLAYFDCVGGAGGDMILGALVDAGLDVEFLEGVVAALGLSAVLRAEKVSCRGLAATRVIVDAPDEAHERNLAEIERIIRAASGLSERVVRGACRIFRRLAEAEAYVHGMDISEVHFHEVGAIDCIVDVVCACAGLEQLGVERIFVSELPAGCGTVSCRHGVLPVPAPATVRLCRDVPVRGTDMRAELVTPTGAAILTTLSSGWGPMPAMFVRSCGYGAGSHEHEGGLPNVLRLFVGDEASVGSADEVVVMEASLDDMSPELVSSAATALLGAGALDVHVAPVVMKKGRPGVVLTVICSPADEDRLADEVFRTTTTLGLRCTRARRRKLERAFRDVDTRYGRVRVKCGVRGGVVAVASPEYESCVSIAREAGVAVRAVYDAASAACGGLVGTRVDES